MERPTDLPGARWQWAQRLLSLIALLVLAAPATQPAAQPWKSSPDSDYAWVDGRSIQAVIASRGGETVKASRGQSPERRLSGAGDPPLPSYGWASVERLVGQARASLPSDDVPPRYIPVRPYRARAPPFLV